jgi:hypothetical protein
MILKEFLEYECIGESVGRPSAGCPSIYDSLQKQRLAAAKQPNPN